MNKTEYQYFLYLRDKLDRAVEDEAIRQVTKLTKSKPVDYKAMVEGSDDDYFDVKVFRSSDGSFAVLKRVAIKDILKAGKNEGLYFIGIRFTYRHLLQPSSDRQRVAGKGVSAKLQCNDQRCWRLLEQRTTLRIAY